MINIRYSYTLILVKIRRIQKEFLRGYIDEKLDKEFEI